MHEQPQLLRRRLPLGQPAQYPALLLKVVSLQDRADLGVGTRGTTVERAVPVRVGLEVVEVGVVAGTGESAVANGPDGELYLAGVLDWLRSRFPQARRAGAIGLSFGGHWTTKLALTGRVDAAVSFGGLVAEAFEAENVTRLRFGMRGIFGNSLCGTGGLAVGQRHRRSPRPSG